MEQDRYAELWERVDLPPELLGLLQALFALSYADLKKAAEVGSNPVEHHLVVLALAARIAQAGGSLSPDDTRRLGAAAILHDIAPVPKIKKRYLEGRPPEEQAQLEQLRVQHRLWHMREGAGMAHGKLLLLNEYRGRVVFSDEDMRVVCDEIIRIHDDPSIDVPIPSSNRLAVVFREADRLWMISREGFWHGILEKVTDPTDRELMTCLAMKRLNDYLPGEYSKERGLYDGSCKCFVDGTLFFRNPESCRMYEQARADRAEEVDVVKRGGKVPGC
jgi:hypothetical protein